VREIEVRLPKRASEIARYNAIVTLESQGDADLSLAVWSLLYLAFRGLEARIDPTAPAEVYLSAFIEEAIKAYQDLTGEPWRPAEQEPAHAEILMMPAQA